MDNSDKTYLGIAGLLIFGITGMGACMGLLARNSNQKVNADTAITGSTSKFVKQEQAPVTLPTYIAPRYPTFHGERFHSIYGIGEHEKWYDLELSKTFRSPFDNQQFCNIGTRANTGTQYAVCYDVSYDCTFFMPAENYDPNGDNMGWLCGP